MTEPSTAEDVSLESLVARVADEFRERQGRGERPDVEEYAVRHPVAASTLRRVLGSLQLLESLAGGDAPAGDAALGALGDFRIVREIGRGGMGVVYEAEQISLHRRVALKVLPFAATMDPRHLQRFQNEARAAACLHHTNIVPVFAVGCERGVHFYAMQLIDGCTLADAIQGLRRPARPPSPLSPRGRGAGGEGDSSPLSPGGRGVGSEGAGSDADVPTTAHVPADGVADPKADTVPAARQSTLGPAAGREYFRRVAQLGVQAAEALDHAHQVGIVHRDVKPGNLLLDVRGCVWVADFGLAHMQHGEASLTMTGDLVGTLRYMSPEQALAQRVPIDHRTDVYSLGATLYELLTLQPAFGGKDRQEVLRQIAFEEPKPPRRIAKGVPAELEVIVLKAMSKNPAERYGTAQEMADDLRRFLDDKPIRARRPSWRKVAARWVRRHRPAVWAGAVVAVIAALFGGGAGVVWVQQRAAVEAEAGRALHEAADFQEQGKWPEALAAARHAEAAATAGPADAGLRERVRRRRADLEMVARVEEIRLLSTAVKDGNFDYAVRDPEYAQAFREYGIDVAALGPAEAGARIRATSVPVALAAALDDWALVCKAMRKKGDTTWKDLLAAARAADPDDWRNQVRDALASKLLDLQALKNLASSDRAADQPPSTLVLIGWALRMGGAVDEAAALLRTAQRRQPGDFWINEELYFTFADPKSRKWEEAVRFATAASVLRPQSPVALFNLGCALGEKGTYDEAIAAYQEAIRLKPDYAMAYNNLGVALSAKGSLDEAVAACKQAIRLKPDYANAYYNLGNALYGKGSLDEAIAAYKEAIRLKPDYADAYGNLGLALVDKGSLDEAVAACNEAIRLKPDFPEAYNNLGNALSKKGSLDEALAAHKEAIRLKPDYAMAYYNLGAALARMGSLDEAVAAYQAATRLKPDYALAYNNLGAALDDKGSFDEAVAADKEAIRLKPDFAMAYCNLGRALTKKGSLDEAVAAFKEAIRLKPDFAEAYANLGAALADKGSLDEAAAAYQEAIRLKPDFAEAYVNLGAALGDKGSLDEAVAAFKEAIRLRPDYVEAYYNLGSSLTKKGSLDEAVAAFKEAIRLKPDFAEAYVNLGAALADKGSLDEAVAAYKKAIRLKPDFPEAYNNLGNALSQKGSLDEAVAAYKEAIRLRPDYALAYNNLAAALIKKGSLKEAIAALKEAIRLKPDYADAHCNLGDGLGKKGSLDEAVAACKEAIRLKPDFAEAYFSLGNALSDKGSPDEAVAALREAIRLKPDFAEAHCNLGNALRENGQLDEAVAECREAIRLNKDDAFAHNNLGAALAQKGRLDEAAAEYREAIRLNKDDAFAHNNLGMALHDKGQLDEAIAECREAIRLKNDFAEAHGTLGNALRDKGRLDEAIAECREAVRLKKDSAEAHNNLGAALWDKGRLDEAVAEFREAIRLKKDYPEAHNNLGGALWDKGRLDEAVVECQEAIRLKKDFAGAHYSLGMALHGKGQLDEAVAEYREAIRLKKDFAGPHYSLGKALFDMGQLDEAVAEYREAIRLKNDYAEAHCALGDLLRCKGQFAEALAELRLGHELGSRNPRWPYPSAQWVRDCERQVELDGKLPAILSAQKQPADTEERLALAFVCQTSKHYYAAAARFYGEAFAEKPQLADDPSTRNRYNAACAAALAGCGQGDDKPAPDEKERMHWRRQALDWLRAELKAQTAQTNSKIPDSRNNAVMALRHWQEDTDLAGVRGEAALARLPEAEREEWRTLWADVEKTLAQAPDAAPEGKGKDKP